MQVRILGCSGTIAKGCRTTSFLLDEHVLIDAGTGVGELTLEEMQCVDHVFLTHSHLDHIAALPLLPDAVGARRSRPLQVHALPATLAALRSHIFNGVVWPDFTRLPSAEQPVLEMLPCAIGDVLHLNGKRIEVLPAAHTVPAVGYAVDGGDAGWWVYSGDTGPNPLLWQRLARMKVAHLVIETAFADEERALAHISQHLCPAELGSELAHLGGSVDVHITHIKPGEMDAVMAEIGRLKTPHRVSALTAGQLIQLG